MDKHGFMSIQKKLRMTHEQIAEAMDIDLFQVQQWASGIWDIPRSMQKFLRTLLSMERDMTEVYVAAYGRGYAAGKNRIQVRFCDEEKRSHQLRKQKG
jgi:hypothetical protein